MSHLDAAHETVDATAVPPERTVAGPSPEAEVTAAAARTSRLDVRGALTLQSAAGNAALGRMLARQATTTPTGIDDTTLINPFDEELAEEEKAQAAQARAHDQQQLRERLLELLNLQQVHRFLPALRALNVYERVILQDDEQWWLEVKRHMSGFSLWTIQRILEYGAKQPQEVNELSAAVFGRDGRRIHDLLMAYPRLKRVPGLRDVLTAQFTGAELTSLLARVDEPDGERSESGSQTWQEAHYEDGVMSKFTGTRNYELVRTASQLRVIVRIKLTEDPNKPGGMKDKSIERWRQGITSHWNNKFRLRSGATTLDVWFVPVFVFWDTTAHHDVTVSAGDDRSDEHHWWEDDSGETAAHEFGHMIGNPDEYNLPGTTAEIPASMKLTDKERKRSSWEGITGNKLAVNTEGYDMENLMGAHHKNASVRERHGWDVLEVFNASKLRHADEQPFQLELK